MYRELFDFIFLEVTNLSLNHFMFREAVGRLEKSNAYNKGLFANWIESTYVSDSLVRIRRLSENKKGMKSFYRLLQKLVNDPLYLSRERYISLYKPEQAELGQSDFNSIAGFGNDYFPITELKNDMAILKNQADVVNEYANYYVTHKPDISKISPTFKVPTFEDITDTIRIFEQFAIKYKMVIFAENQTEILPKMQVQWEKIFSKE